MPDPLKFRLGDKVQISVTSPSHAGEFGEIHTIDPSECILPYYVHFGDGIYDWFRAGRVLARHELETNRTIYVTPRMATAQDLLHEVISLREQLKTFFGGTDYDYFDAAKHHLERIFGEEAAEQMKGKQ
jgi:hypothetical protein